jgi:hypothetical protein
MSPNRLAILPDLTHYDIFLAPALAAAVLPFLNGESGSKSWSDRWAPEIVTGTPM